MAHWLLKSEPDTFGYDDLVANGREGWDGVRNYTARIHLRAMRKGDTAIFYHSNAKPPGAAGICKIVREAEPDPTQFDPTSHYYDPGSKPFVSLDELRTMPELASSQLLARGNRLSVLPLTDGEFDAILRAGGVRPPRR
jgi:predicted RNA-binding protein with PUA-like domain